MTDQTQPSRRTLLRFAAAGGTSVAISGVLGAPGVRGAPQELAPRLRARHRRPAPRRDHRRLHPHLHALRSGGTWYPNARSLPIMETIPNHVMMMTGVRPDRSGVPANKIYDRGLGEVRDMDQPSDIKVPTVIERLNARGLTTGTVLSKDYLYGIFGDRATYRWEPKPLMPITDHAPDGYTYDALVKMVDEADPHLVFANFGDIDRVGHADLGGTINLPAMRYAALANTDRLVGNFVEHLKAKGCGSSRSSSSSPTTRWTGR